jgi:hypothetical protein
VSVTTGDSSQFHHNVASLCQPRPAAWVVDTQTHTKPQRGGPKFGCVVPLGYSHCITFVCRLLGPPRWGWTSSTIDITQAAGLGWHRAVPLGLTNNGASVALALGTLILVVRTSRQAQPDLLVRLSENVIHTCHSPGLPKRSSPGHPT